MKNTKKMFALVLILAIMALPVSALLFSQNSAGINYSPNTGDTPWEMIIFIGLGIIAVLLLVFVVLRRKR